MKFYLTYPWRIAELRKCYSVIEADDYDAACDAAIDARDGTWAFIYTEEQFMGTPNGLGIHYPSQVEAFGLTEIPLIPTKP